MSHAPEGVRGNFNRLVATALGQLVEQARRQSFAESMADMAGDPAIRRECAGIAAAFELAESDGLEND